MTLLLTEIHLLDGLSHSCIIFAADQRISINGKYNAIREKNFKIPYLKAGIGYFGLAEIPKKGNNIPMRDWLKGFIDNNTNIQDLQTFASVLEKKLNSDIPLQYRTKYKSGFHLAGYNSMQLPEFWFIRNIQENGMDIFNGGKYEANEYFLKRDAVNLGYDGKDPHSARTGIIQIYRNGDIRAHATAWGNIDEAFMKLLTEPEFKKLKSIQDYEEWIKFKMEIISYFYEKYCKISIVAKPIDVFSIESY
jgi:hypothetical protein